ncbi:MAG: hypothetical protein R3Y46_07905 [Opitutales bacterium]
MKKIIIIEILILLGLYLCSLCFLPETLVLHKNEYAIADSFISLNHFYLKLVEYFAIYALFSVILMYVFFKTKKYFYKSMLLLMVFGLYLLWTCAVLIISFNISSLFYDLIAFIFAMSLVAWIIYLPYSLIYMKIQELKKLEC